MEIFRERQTVSRKTAGDGKLEITKVAAQRLQALGPQLTLVLGGESGSATLATMECICRGGEKPHVHYFLESERFKTLEPGSTVEIELESATSQLTVKSNLGD